MTNRTIITNSDINRSNLRVRTVLVEDKGQMGVIVRPVDEGASDLATPGQRVTKAVGGGRALLIEEVEVADAESST
jgi:hypothetical protein